MKMVNPQPVSSDASEEAAWGMINGNGIKKFDKFADEIPEGSGNYVDKPVGTFYEGIVADMPKQYPATDYDSGEVKRYKDGEVIQEIGFLINTNYRLDDEDTGQRRVRLGQNGKAALQQEMKRLGIKRFGIGTGIRMEFSGYGTNKSGKGRPPKLFNITLWPTEYVAPQQLAVEQQLAQAGYTAVAQTSFPPAPPQQSPAAIINAPQQYAQAPQPPQVQVFAPAPQQAPASPPQLAQAPQVAPQQQYVNPAQPAFPGQVVPAPQVTAPQLQAPNPAAAAIAAAIAPQAPVQYAQVPAGDGSGFDGIEEPVQAGTPVVLQDHVNNVTMLMSNNIDRQTAISAVADQVAAGNTVFASALDAAIPAA